MNRSMGSGPRTGGMHAAIAAVAPERQHVTISLNQRTVAFMLSSLTDLDDGAVRAHAERFMAEISMVSPPVRQAIEDFGALGHLLHEVDGVEEPTDGQWAVCVCFICDQLDDLLAMAEPSGYSDPGELLDPMGTDEPLLTHMALIAEQRRSQGDKRFTRRLVAWLRKGADHEEREHRFLLRAKGKRERWPWNAVGAMGRSGGSMFAMKTGCLRPLERRFRATMVRARSLARPRRRRLQAAQRLLVGFRGDTDPIPPRMEGLLGMAAARLHVADLANQQARGPTSADQPRVISRQALEEQVVCAEGLIEESGCSKPEDRAGIEILRRNIHLFANAYARRI